MGKPNLQVVGPLAALVLMACAHNAAPPATEPTKPGTEVGAAAHDANAIASLLPWLPGNAVLVGRLDAAALDELGFAKPLLGQWMPNERAALLLDGAREALFAVAPSGDGSRVVVLIRGAHRPDDKATTWTAVAEGTWLGCVQSCEGFVPGRAALIGAQDLRATIAKRIENELAMINASISRDASNEPLRARLLDGPVSVLSELDVAALRITQEDTALDAQLRARFASAGVASNAALLLRGALADAADELERVGLSQEADELMGLRIELKSAMTSAGETEDAELQAMLRLPVQTLPALALAWSSAQRAAHEQEQAEQASVDEPEPVAAVTPPEVITARVKAARAQRGYARAIDPILAIAGQDLELLRLHEDDAKSEYLAVRVPKLKRHELRTALAEKLAPLKLSVVLIERGHGATPAVLGVFRTRDALDVLELLQTGGVGSAVLRKNLADLRQLAPFRVLEAKRNYVQIELESAPGELEAIVQRWLTLCPSTSPDAQRAQLRDQRVLDCFLD